MQHSKTGYDVTTVQSCVGLQKDASTSVDIGQAFRRVEVEAKPRKTCDGTESRQLSTLTALARVGSGFGDLHVSSCD